jgi:nicotinamide phosphoribosyltransferase
MGTDTMAGVLAAREFYDEPVAGFSIPAAEHSTITAWGRDGEADAYRNMLNQFAKPGSVVAVVSDSYDLFDALERLWGGELRQQVINSGATVVIRPDSGVPEEIVLQTAIRLERAFGSTTNKMGYKVLKHVRIIQGDGINEQSIRQILSNLKFNGFSADNVAFGMGGALLQQINRDTFRFAMKTSAVRIGSGWRDVFKSPATDPGKRSKAGRISAWRNQDSGEIFSARIDPTGWIDQEIEASRSDRFVDLLQPVWRNGELLRDERFADIRQRASSARPQLPSHWLAI